MAPPSVIVARGSSLNSIAVIDKDDMIALGYELFPNNIDPTVCQPLSTLPWTSLVKRITMSFFAWDKTT